MFHRRTSHSGRRILSISEYLELGSLSVSVIVVCSLPWVLGGVLPVTRLSLLAGTVVSGVLSILSHAVGRRAFHTVSVISLLLSCMAVIGLVQLLPIYDSPLDDMAHAVFPAYRSEFGSNGTDANIAGAMRTSSPADTRMAIAQWLTLAMLMTTIADTRLTKRRLFWILSLLTANAAAMALVGISQMFGEENSSLGDSLRISDTPGFGPFVNPNNAAGWLCINLGAAIGLMVLVWGKEHRLGYSKPFQKPSVVEQFLNALELLKHRTSQLNSAQLMALMAIVVIFTGAIATLSRGGMIAAVLSTVVIPLRRLHWKQFSIFAVLLAVLFVLSAGLMSLLDLNRLALSEIETLTDPVSAAEGRLKHWSDSLGAVIDFPLLGSGQGAYRFSTLPYQNHYWRKWFMNADNQYFEWLVESGVCGLLVCLAMGVSLLKLTRQLTRRAESKGSFSVQCLTVCSVVGGVLIVSQAVTALVDYGIANPSNAAALTLLSGLLVSMFCHPVVAQNAGKVSVADPGSQTFGIVLQLPKAGHWVYRLGLMVGLLIFLADLYAATQINFASIAVEKHLQLPVTQEGFLVLERLRAELKTTLTLRPDDLRGLASLSKAEEVLFRRAVLRRLADGQELSDRDFGRVWEVTSIGFLSQRVAMLKNQPPTPDSLVLMRALRDLAEYRDWKLVLAEAKAVTPLQPNLFLDELSIHVLEKNAAPIRETCLKSMFVMPSEAAQLYRIGALCLLLEDSATADLCLKRSLMVSDQFRDPVLEVGLIVMSPERLVAAYGPDAYAATVRAARNCRDRELTGLLWERADDFWQRSGDTQSVEDLMERSFHLELRSDHTAAIAWLQKCVSEHPDDRGLGVRLATLLQTSGRNDEALNEWIRLNYYFPGDRQIEKAISELSH